MPQVQLPIFPHGTTLITQEFAFERRKNQVVYFSGHLPVFTHEVDDVAAFRMFTSQLIVNGTATQRQIVEAFGVPLRTVKRYVKIYRENGTHAFFTSRPRRQGYRLTPEVLAEAQRMLDEGKEVPEIAEKTGVMQTTLHKAISSGRLRRDKKKVSESKSSIRSPRRQPRVSAAFKTNKPL